jgi:hypothetical protein
MNKALTVLVAASAIGFAAIVTPAPAEARCVGCAIGVGVAAGLIGGALIAGAANAAPPPPPAYYAPAPVYGPGPGCYTTRGPRVWDDYDGVWRRQRVLVCP